MPPSEVKLTKSDSLTIKPSAHTEKANQKQKKKRRKGCCRSLFT
jgi:hypothetical protein